MTASAAVLSLPLRRWWSERAKLGAVRGGRFGAPFFICCNRAATGLLRLDSAPLHVYSGRAMEAMEMVKEATTKDGFWRINAEFGVALRERHLAALERLAETLEEQVRYEAAGAEAEALAGHLRTLLFQIARGDWR